MCESGIRVSRVNFCPSIRFWEVHFARPLSFCQLLTEYVLSENSSFGTQKFMKVAWSLDFWALFCPGIRLFGEILPGLGFALAAHPYLPSSESPPPPRLKCRICHKKTSFKCQKCSSCVGIVFLPNRKGLLERVSRRKRA